MILLFMISQNETNMQFAVLKPVLSANVLAIFLYFETGKRDGDELCNSAASYTSHSVNRYDSEASAATNARRGPHKNWMCASSG